MLPCQPKQGINTTDGERRLPMQNVVRAQVVRRWSSVSGRQIFEELDAGPVIGS
jgi:hypothetical protein